LETTNIVRNPGFWLADLPEVTAYCAVRRYTLRFGDNHVYCPNATLLTPRHVFQAKHSLIPKGSGVVYVSRSNHRIVRRVIDWQPVGDCDTNTFNGMNDCMVIQQLDEPVPPEFIPLKLLPSGANQYLGDYAPVLFGHQVKSFGIVYLI